MKFGSSKSADRQQRANSANPFMVLAEGPGVAVAKGALFTSPISKRRRWDAQSLGETPRRDGPFAQAAKPLATMYPPRRRANKPKRTGGANPFG